MTEYKIKSAEDLKKEISETEKDNKFNQMVELQQKIIKEAIQDGCNHIVWVFFDKGYYHTDMQKEWFDEFKEKAIKLFEDAGYKIGGCVISW